MKRFKAPLGLGVLLLLAAAATALAAPSPSFPAFPAFLAAATASSPAPAPILDPAAVVNANPATPMDADGCGLRMYSCQDCLATTPKQKLCYTQNCGTFVIVHCDPCANRCIVPPA